MRQKGSMTIAMCMMLSVMLGIVAAGIKLCREQYARVQAVNAADTGLYSVFSEYERDLLEEYDLFFLDSGYGRGAIDAYHGSDFKKRHPGKQAGELFHYRIQTGHG